MTSKTSWTLVTALLFVGGVAFALAGTADPDPSPSAPAAVPEAVSVGQAPQSATVQVWKSPSCGCCSGWVDHMREAGFEVEVHDVADMQAVKAEHGIPGELGSCHTALVGGYLVEGHVPAADVERLLAERPAVDGIAVPGMPVGSPGMEVPGRPADRYRVIAFTGSGGRSVFAEH